MGKIGGKNKAECMRVMRGAFANCMHSIDSEGSPTIPISSSMSTLLCACEEGGRRGGGGAARLLLRDQGSRS
jgi:hypothetical protein